MARIYFVLLLFAGLLPGQTPGPRTVAGISRRFDYDRGQQDSSAAAIVEASGLKLGEKGNAATFDAARDRLIATGYFDTVGYRYKACGCRAGL